ncbi:MAG TPA: molybdopterin-dependent oxidoreductase [Vicinamibacterales bacterium]|nr:molybdopterin-dependent oxidoreductase [Vicinamibacterales bacterium]
MGLLQTTFLVAVSYVGWKTAGLPFVPFDLFDWAARVLPGSVVTVAIEWLIAIALALHAGNISTAAKVAEQLIAVTGQLAIGSVAASLLFAGLSYSDEPAVLPGGVLGAILGLFAILVELQVNKVSSQSMVNLAWVAGTFVTWGIALGWMSDRLNRVKSRQTDGRRQFFKRLVLVTGLPSLLTALWGYALEGRRVSAPGARWSDDHPLPNDGARVTPLVGTRPELTRLENHYRIDIDTRAPVIDINQWHLTIGGLIERPTAMTLSELRREEPLHQFVTLSCISNPVGGDLIGTTRWTGVSLRRLVRQWGVQPRATHMRITSADGFFETVALDLIERDPRVMLTYAWDGLPLLAEHGFPLRIYIPDVYGMKQPKWIVGIDFIDRWEPGYWVQRGWDREGRMLATSAIDVVAIEPKPGAPDGRKEVVAGGIAHAGARGISKVEARVDDGEWREAQVRDPVSETTWIVWRADLAAPDGDHTISVRCSEADGTPQPGAFHNKRIKLS